jgi:hypothetical protein
LSTAAFVALVLVSTWLAVLTLTMILCIRQIALVTLRLDRGDSFSFADDGPIIGSEVSEEVLERLAHVNGASAYLLSVSATCGPCRELAEELARKSFPERLVVLLTGRAEIADGLAGLFPNTARIIRDPHALSITNALTIGSTPFAVKIEDGIVAGKSYINRVSDLESLSRASAATQTDSISGEVKSHAG